MRFSAIFLGLGPLMDLILHVMIMQNVSKVLNECDKVARKGH